MAKIHTVSVRELAEFTCLKGDLAPSLPGRMNDGKLGHRAVQEALEPGWLSEEAVSREESVHGMPMKIQGRADAVYREEDFACILEIKTTVQEPSRIREEDMPAHMAQGIIYAYLICANEKRGSAEVRLMYYRLDGRRHTFRRNFEFSELKARFLEFAEPYADWLRVLTEWKTHSAETLESMPFPFETFREGQREMADQVYEALCGRCSTLIEAPTGIGKTAASLYGALKALAAGKVTALFYLTARTTGRRAAENALRLVRAKGGCVRSVTITAKDKICPMQPNAQGKHECFGCEYAADYYERRRPALEEALANTGHIGENELRELGEKYALCPYELSLDISEETDVIICDYNYAFDPRVHLRRWFDRKSKAGLLIDEAHNLPDRAGDMLSAELSGTRVAAARDLLRRFEGEGTFADVLLTGLLEVLTKEQTECEALSELPEGFADTVTRFGDLAQTADIAEPEVRELVWEAVWFARAATRFDAEHYRFLIYPEEENRILVRLWCWDPSAHIRRILTRVGGTALFSATLAPMEHYAALLGLNTREDDTLLQLPSPFPSENLLTVQLPVSVKFADRTRTEEAVVQILRAMTQAHPGNYIACFPSFAYMNAVFEHYRIEFPEERVIRQKGYMSEAERTRFIDSFRPHPKKSMLAFIVLGGVFAEGVDLPDDRLSGAAVISTGMPQIGYERGLLTELFDDGFGGGYDAAFTYPGIRRVLQAAGRVIRTESDRGVVLLIDQRYAAENIRPLLPEHWQVRHAKKLDALRKMLDRFWRTE